MPPGCPKHMVFGPCGGVLQDGCCELGDRRCTFVDLPTVRWDGAVPHPVPPLPAAEAMRRLLAARPVVVADLSAPPMSPAALREIGGLLAEDVDAVLVGDARTPACSCRRPIAPRCCRRQAPASGPG